MKKKFENEQLYSKQIFEKSINEETIKTTDINILLNRVRIQNKKNIKKKIKILFFLILLIITLTSISLL